MSIEVAASAAVALGAGAVLFVGTGMLCTAAMLCSTKGLRPRGPAQRATAAAPRRPRPGHRAKPRPAGPAEDPFGVPLHPAGFAGLSCVRGRTR